MNFPLKPRLLVEALEARETPNATVANLAGTLTIRSDNTPNNVVIVENNPGLFDVTVNGAPRGTYGVRDISVSMGGGNDTVDLGVTTTLPGWLSVNLGGGNDSFTTKNNSVIGAKIAGTVTINTGTVAPLIGNYDEVVELYNLNLAGPTVRVTGASGSGTSQLDMQSTTVGGTLIATSIYEVDLGAPAFPAAAVTINNAVVDNTFKNTDSRTDAKSGPGNILFMFSASVITGSLTVYGGPGRDDIDLPGEGGTSIADAVIGGNVAFYGRNGRNTLALGDGTFGAQIGGNVTFIGGTGTDRFFFDSGSTVGRDLNVNLLGGNDMAFGDPNVPFDPAGNALVVGNMTLNMGEGNNFIGTYDLGSQLNVFGNLKVAVGSGNNVGGPASTPGAITFFNPNVLVSGIAEFAAGRGSQAIEISNPDLGRLVITLGGGMNSVNFTIPSFHGNATIDFGFGPGPYAFETDIVPTTFDGVLVLRHFA